MEQSISGETIVAIYVVWWIFVAAIVVGLGTGTESRRR